MLDLTSLRMCADALNRVKLIQTGLKRGDMRTSLLLAELDKTRTELVIMLDRMKAQK